MKNYRLLYFTFLLFLPLFILNFSSGPGSTAGLALTMAPGEGGGFCGNSGCHSDGAFNQTTRIEVRDANGDSVTEYNPNSEYSVSVIIDAGTGEPGGYGFQMVAIKDQDESGLDGWDEGLVNGVQSVVIDSRKYIEHNSPNTSSNIFTIPWTAPDGGSGSVTFYASGNAVNLNGSSSGDGANSTETTLGEAITSSTQDEALSNSIKIFPNPAKDEVFLDFTNNLVASVSIYNLSGQRVFTDNKVKHHYSIDISDFASGMYYMHIRNTETGAFSTKKLVKQ